LTDQLTYGAITDFSSNEEVDCSVADTDTDPINGVAKIARDKTVLIIFFLFLCPLENVIFYTNKEYYFDSSYQRMRFL
jgi:hypothetical protein